MNRLLSLFGALLLCAYSNAQVKQEIFESFKLQERRDVHYYIPEDYDEEKKYPLIVVLDAERLFDQVVANAKYYSRFHGMPESIIVGIDQNKGNLREQDCAYDPRTGLPMDKGPKFYEFIGMELIPYLDTHYNTAPFKMIVGYGISANFSQYYLFKEQSLFDAYIVMAPEFAPKMQTRIPERLAAMEQDIFYHLTLDGDKKAEYRPAVQALDHNLKGLGKDNIHYSYTEYPSADHISVATYGMGKAFDKIFTIFKPITPEEYKTQILTSEEPVFAYLANKYETIETLFGFEKPVALNDIMAIYAGCRKKEDTESLKELSDLCKKEYPDTMLGFYFEGEYFEWMGEPKKALKTFEKAFGMEEIDFLTKDMALDKMDALKADFGF